MMSMKRLFAVILIFLTAAPLIYSQPKDKKLKLKKAKIENAIEDTLTNEYLDTIKINKTFELNDYSMIGFQYGAGLSRVSWNPSQKQDMLLMPVNVGVFYTNMARCSDICLISEWKPVLYIPQKDISSSIMRKMTILIR